MIDERNDRLSRCKGFAVFDPGRRVGVVAGLEFGSRSDRPDYLVVRRRRLIPFGNPSMRVPVEQVVEIDLERRRILVHGAPVGRIRWTQPAAEKIEEGVVVQSRPPS